VLVFGFSEVKLKSNLHDGYTFKLYNIDIRHFAQDRYKAFKTPTGVVFHVPLLPSGFLEDSEEDDLELQEIAAFPAGMRSDRHLDPQRLQRNAILQSRKEGPGQDRSMGKIFVDFSNALADDEQEKTLSTDIYNFEEDWEGDYDEIMPVPLLESIELEIEGTTVETTEVHLTFTVSIQEERKRKTDKKTAANRGAAALGSLFKGMSVAPPDDSFS
jgi:hypothetical protein